MLPDERAPDLGDPGQHRAGVRDRRPRPRRPRAPPDADPPAGGSLPRWRHGHEWVGHPRPSRRGTPATAPGLARIGRDVAQHRPVARHPAASRAPSSETRASARDCRRRPHGASATRAPCRGGRCRHGGPIDVLFLVAAADACHGPCGRHDPRRRRRSRLRVDRRAAAAGVSGAASNTSASSTASPNPGSSAGPRRTRTPAHSAAVGRGAGRDGCPVRRCRHAAPLARRVPVRIRGSARDRPRPGSAADRLPRALTRP
jgi:hypothetical protein